MLLTDAEKAEFAKVLGTWTVDVSIPPDTEKRWGHLSEESCALIANCVATWLACRDGGQ